MFDKAEYWKNRKAGKRGQGKAFNPVGKVHPSVDWTPNPDTKKSLLKKAGK